MRDAGCPRVFTGMISRRLLCLPFLVLPACGGASSSSTETVDDTTSLLAEEMTGDHPSCERAHPDLSAADTDGDGVLSDAERQAFREARIAELLAEFDADGDGELSREERQAVRDAKRAERFDTLDADDDGLLSEEEVAETCRLSIRFAAIDTDGDGAISLEEFSVKRWGRKGRARLFG